MKNINQIRNLLIAGAIAVVAWPGSQAQAAVIEADWMVAGDNKAVFDQATGLKWLDLTETAGLSFNTVSAQLGAGGTFAGFSYATAAQVNTLYTNAGMPNIGPSLGSFTAANYTPAKALMTLFGGPLNVVAFPFSDGMTATTGLSAPDLFGNQSPIRKPGRLQHCQAPQAFPNGFPCGTGLAQAVLWDRPLIDNNAATSTGSYLVMSSVVVPLPAALPLFAAGLALIGLAGWRKRAASA